MSEAERVSELADGARRATAIIQELRPLGIVALDLNDLAAAEARWLPLLDGVRRSATTASEIAERIRATHPEDANGLTAIAGVLGEYVRVTDEGRLFHGRPSGDDPAALN